MGTNDEKQAVDVVAWGRDIERRHAWLLHAQNLAAGPVDRFFTGEEGDRYMSDVDGAPVAAPVIILGTGHALLARDPAAFIEIGPDEAAIYITTIERLRTTIVDACNDAATVLRARKIHPDLPMVLVVAALRAQLNALEATATAHATSLPTLPPAINEPPASTPS